MKTINALLMAAAAMGAITAAPALAAPSITYAGTDTEGDVRFDYTITTDGTLGNLALSNIVGSTITYTGLSTQAGNSHNFASFTATNNLYFTNLDDQANEKPISGVRATATALYFDFGGSGDLNFSTANCAGINSCDNAPQATPNEQQQGLVYAFAAQNTNEYGSVVYHEGTLPTKELDDFYRSQDFRLQPGYYTQVSATDQVVATATATAGAGPTGAVPEPSGWALMIAGVGLVGYGLRRRRALVRLAAA